MAEKNINTTTSVKAKEVTDKELEAQVKKAAAAVKDTKKEKISIPTVLQRHIGATLPLSINGVPIVVPVDGKEYEIPAPYAVLLREYLEALKN